MAVIYGLGAVLTAICRESIDAEQGTSWRDLLRPGLRGALVAGLRLAVFQQFTGPNTVLFYGPLVALGLIFRAGASQYGAGPRWAAAGYPAR